MQTIIEALMHTPWWVFLLLGYLLIVGIQALQTRVISLYKIVIGPIIFSGLSIYTLLTASAEYIAIGGWTAAILLGSATGFWQTNRLAIKVDRKHFLLQIPGSWSTLIIMLIIFSVKYYTGYSLARNPALAQEIHFTLSLLSISGLCTGLFLGKLIAYLRHFFRSNILSGEG